MSQTVSCIVCIPSLDRLALFRSSRFVLSSPRRSSTVCISQRERSNTSRYVTLGIRWIWRVVQGACARPIQSVRSRRNLYANEQRVKVHPGCDTNHFYQLYPRVISFLLLKKKEHVYGVKHGDSRSCKSPSTALYKLVTHNVSSCTARVGYEEKIKCTLKHATLEFCVSLDIVTTRCNGAETIARDSHWW